MDRFHEMQVFVAVAEEEGFAAAARRLNTSPPSVTRAIAAMEQRIGTQLLARARLSCATVQGAINAAVHGAGLVRCLSYPVHEHLVAGQLRRVLHADELPPVPVHVVYREGRNAPMRVRSFVDHCVVALREHPAFQLA